jgi:lipoprotein signal peptidase
MPLGMTNMTSVSMQNLTDIGNVTTFPEFAINVNQIVFDGYLYFILLFVLWIIMFVAAQNVKDQLLNNLMYSGAIVSVISFFMRAIYILENGVVYGLINDFQLWVFPLITICLAVVSWATKN